jgi:DNA-binding MarR family transcriptional regulator
MTPPTSPDSQSTAWTFITSHAQVLLYIAGNPGARVRDIAHDLDFTERTVYKILRDLEDGGYITRRRKGNRVEFTIHAQPLLRAAPVRDVAIRQLLMLLGPPDG